MSRTAWIAALVLTGSVAAGKSDKKVYARDVEFALAELEKKCGHFFELKGIRWPQVRRDIKKRLKKVKDHQQYYELLVRLLARLEDGHASVLPRGAGKELRWPGPELGAGAGLFWCRSGKKVLVKNSWSKAAAAGVKPGMEVVAVDGIPAAKWLDARIAELGTFIGFGTEQHGVFFTSHWGLGGKPGSRLKLELRTPDRKSKKVTLTRGKASVVPVGPPLWIEGLKREGRQSYGRTKGGYGYIHLRDVPRNLPQQLDKMLAALQDPSGLILDCRANGGGGCDHDAVFGRFLPTGKTFKVPKKTYRSAGPNPYGGPMIVIVDAGVRSAGETISGMFKEDGRAYMIGETPTAGTSSVKEVIELPSKLFALRVSVHSNKARFNRGKGIEGLGVIPNDVVEYEQKDLAAGVDTLLRRAEELMRNFPRNKVLYRPKSFGWRAQ